MWYKPGACFLGSKLRLRRVFENILWFSKGKKPSINLMANGNYSDRIGFTGSFRFSGESNPLATNQPSKLRIGQARGSDVFTAYVADNENGIIHPAAYPVKLCEQLTLQFTREGDTVLDPFCGSGTTLLAAQRLGRRWIGFDLKKEYVELAAKRLGTTYTEHGTAILPGQPVRLRTDFPDNAQSRRIYFQSRRLNSSDAAVFEYVLSKTVFSDERNVAVELSHNRFLPPQS
jgi:SAM-dependent methyltransferase